MATINDIIARCPNCEAEWAPMWLVSQCLHDASSDKRPVMYACQRCSAEFVCKRPTIDNHGVGNWMLTLVVVGMDPNEWPVLELKGKPVV